jgi:hypothetical protein
VNPDGTLDAAIQVSTASGLGPRWRADGRELYYVESAPPLGSEHVVAVPLRAGARGLEIGRAETLFGVRLLLLSQLQPEFDVFPDGRRFVAGVVTGEPEGAPGTLVLNWPAGL